jgi:hypothetical protein
MSSRCSSTHSSGTIDAVPQTTARTPAAYTRAPYYPQGLTTVPFSPALYDTFAVITRPGARLTPGVRELLADLEAHLRTVADELS